LKAEEGNKKGSLASGHKSGGLVSVLALGPSACPRNARDLTFQPFVGIIGAYQSRCFMLSGTIVKGGSAGIWKFVGSPGVEADGFSQASFADKASCWEKLVVASGGKSVC
jgi:hypothetical protein